MIILSLRVILLQINQKYGRMDSEICFVFPLNLVQIKFSEEMSVGVPGKKSISYQLGQISDGLVMKEMILHRKVSAVLQLEQ